MTLTLQEINDLERMCSINDKVPVRPVFLNRLLSAAKQGVRMREALEITNRTLGFLKLLAQDDEPWTETIKAEYSKATSMINAALQDTEQRKG